ncbi:hypothetical protein K458DRAFT_170328 [Lentithecium fluviatile CBS 122367]|uniref:Uncharacterized protein n=1 Tax=Lentithecium fluviatile CBS 122367 TaxID=1168545 RepID=A0A6G1JB86_9PLEO|nr:hypothetical protein K458DRAFT_170328 [Lentithecium fluviatile CBS 122367]
MEPETVLKQAMATPTTRLASERALRRRDRQQAMRRRWSPTAMRGWGRAQNARAHCAVGTQGDGQTGGASSGKQTRPDQTSRRRPWQPRAGWREGGRWAAGGGQRMVGSGQWAGSGTRSARRGVVVDGREGPPP